MVGTFEVTFKIAASLLERMVSLTNLNFSKRDKEERSGAISEIKSAIFPSKKLS